MSDKKDIDEEDIDLDDLDGLEDDLDFGDMEDITGDRKPGVAGVAKELGKEGGKGLLSGLVKGTAKKSLPSSYETNYQTAKDYAEWGKEIADESKGIVNKSAYGLGKEVKKLLPFKIKSLDKYLENYETDNIRKAEASEEAMRADSINATLGGIFDKQLETQKFLQADAQAREETEHKREIVSTKMQTDVLHSIDKNTGDMSAFTLQISKEYYRKSLELQFKTYYVQADLLKHSKDYFKGFSLQLDNVVKNTGLPDFVKLKNTESLKEVMRQRAVNSIQGSLFDNNAYVKKVKERMGRVVTDGIKNITSKVDEATEALSSMSSVSDGSSGTLGLLSSVLSSTAGGVIGDKLSSKIPEKYLDKVKNNRTIQAGGNILDSLANNPKSFLANATARNLDSQAKYEEMEGPLGRIGGLLHKGVGSLLNTTRPDALGGEVKDVSVLSHSEPAIFDNKVHRSITEVIPLYLARILKQNTDLSSMYSSVNTSKLKKTDFSESEEYVYNYGDRKLSTISEYRTSVQNKVLNSSGSKNRLKIMTSKLSNDAAANLKLKKGSKRDIKLLESKESKELLEDYFKRSKEMGLDQDYSTLISEASEGIGSPKLHALLKDTPGLQEVLKAINSSSTPKNKEEFTDKLADVDNKYPTVGVISLFKDTSILSGSKIINKINKEQAKVISKAFATFAHNPQKYGGGGSGVVIPKDIAEGRFLTSFPKKALSDVRGLKKVLQVFVTEVTTILNSGDYLNITGLEKALGKVIGDIDANLNVDVELLQTLRDLNPNLIKKGDITVDNMLEGKLDRGPNIEYVNFKDAKAIGKTGPADLSKNRKDLLESIVTSKFGKDTAHNTREFKKDLKEAGKNPSAVLAVMTKHARKHAEKTKKKLSESYTKATGYANELNTRASAFSKEITSKGLTSFKGTLQNYANEVDKLIRSEKTSLEVAISEMDKHKELVEETTTMDPRDIDNEIALMRAVSEEKIKLYTSLKSSLDKTRLDLDSNIEAMKEVGTDNLNKGSEVFNRLRNTLSTRSSELKELLSRAESLDKRGEQTTLA